MVHAKLIRAAKVITINLIVLVIGLLSVELIFGGWLPANRINASRINNLYILKNVEMNYDVDDLYNSDSKQIIYKRDAHGLRGEYGAPDAIDILTMGGSTTDQRYITEGATWQDVLRREFTHAGKSISIANAGVDGHSTYGHLKAFDWWLPQIPNLKAKYILLYVGINDFYKAPDTYNFSAGRSSTRHYLRQQVRQKSALYFLYRTATDLIFSPETRHTATNFANVAWTDVPLAKDHADLARERVDSYGERLKRLNQRVRAMNATPIFVTQSIGRCEQRDGRLFGTTDTKKFNEAEINGVDHCIILGLLNVKTMQVCRESNGVCIDLARELEFNAADYYDFYHNTPQGAEKIGRYLHLKLDPLF
jgi:hypothetical protein